MEEKCFLNDLVFKDIYGDHLNFLTSFLVSFHPEWEKELKDIIVHKEYPLKRTKISEKLMRGDILIELEKEYINIEAFMKLTKSGLKKTIAYLNRVFGTQMKKNEEDYNELKKVTSIIITKSVEGLDHLKETWLQKYNVQNEKGIILLEDIEIYVLIIDKIKEVDYNDIKENKLMRHLLLMGSTSERERNKIAKGDEDLMTISKYGNDFMNDRETLEYFNTEKTKRLMYRDIYTEEGKAIGQEIGEEIGKQNEKQEIAKNLLDKLDVKSISEATGLTIKEINTLKQKRNNALEAFS